MQDWQASASATLVGSMPHRDRQKVIDLIIRETPEIPVWPQLAAFRAEQMMIQYLEGLPGLEIDDDSVLVRTDTPRFEEEMYKFYEEYLEIEEGSRDLLTSRFSFGDETGKTFYRFLSTMGELAPACRAVKGQIVGPFTLLSGARDQQQRALIYDERLQDVVVKHLAMKAKWQISHLKSFGRPVILFLDEPALAGFGSSAFITISWELVHKILTEVIDAVHEAGALAGIHVCANTDWSLAFQSSVDIINFDAYNYFEKFAIYKEDLFRFMKRRGIVAWGMTPTGGELISQRVTAQGLADRWLGYASTIVSPDFTIERILSHSLFTPTCGCGTLSESEAEMVAGITRELGQILKNRL
jgi:hypothetical protein